MQLIKMIDNLPIDTIGDVTSILGTLIAMVKTPELFADSEDMIDYLETIEHLKRDLKDCFTLYENWQHEPNAAEFEGALAKMESYLHEAQALLEANSGAVH